MTNDLNPENVQLNQEHFRISNLIVRSDELHIEVELLKKVALTSKLVSLSINRGHDHLWSGYLFVEPSGIPGYEELDEDDGSGDFRVPKGTIPNDDAHNGLLYRTEGDDAWDDILPEDADTDNFQYVNYEGAEDSLAGFFAYDSDDYVLLTDALAAQVKVLNDWAAA